MSPVTLSKTKQAILDAALELSASGGITGTTMDDVAAKAGVAKGSLYYNFSSKDQLFEALIEHGIANLVDALVVARGDLTGTAALRQIVLATLDRIQQNRAMSKLLAAELFRTDRMWRESLQEIRSGVIELYAQALREASPSPLPAAVTMGSAIFGAVLVAGLEWAVFEPERGRDEIAAAILAVFAGTFTMPA